MRGEEQKQKQVQEQGDEADRPGGEGRGRVRCTRLQVVPLPWGGGGAGRRMLESGSSRGSQQVGSAVQVTPERWSLREEVILMELAARDQRIDELAAAVRELSRAAAEEEIKRIQATPVSFSLRARLAFFREPRKGLRPPTHPPPAST